MQTHAVKSRQRCHCVFLWRKELRQHGNLRPQSISSRRRCQNAPPPWQHPPCSWTPTPWCVFQIEQIIYMNYTPKQFQLDILEQQFKKDSAGQTAFFPMGSFKPGYIIPDEEKKNEIKQILAKYEMTFFPIVFLSFYTKFSILSIAASSFYFIFNTLNFIKQIKKATLGLEQIAYSKDFDRNTPSKKVMTITLALLFIAISGFSLPQIVKKFGFNGIIAFIVFQIIIVILAIYFLYTSTKENEPEWPIANSREWSWPSFLRIPALHELPGYFRKKAVVGR